MSLLRKTERKTQKSIFSLRQRRSSTLEFSSPIIIMIISIIYKEIFKWISSTILTAATRSVSLWVVEEEKHAINYRIFFHPVKSLTYSTNSWIQTKIKIDIQNFNSFELIAPLYSCF